MLIQKIIVVYFIILLTLCCEYKQCLYNKLSLGNFWLIIGRFFDESDSMVKYKAYGSALKAFIDVVNLIAVDLNYKI